MFNNVQSNLMNSLDMGWVNRFTVAFIVAYILYLLLVPKPNPGSSASFVESVIPKSLNQAQTMDSFEAYIEPIKESGLFDFGEKKQLDEAKSISIQERIKDFRLKGFVDLGDRQAIIEDARTSVSNFYSAGNHLNDVHIREIEEESVVLEFEGEVAEMKMEGF